MLDLNTPLAGLPLAILDTEATGLPPGNRIVEIAVVHLTLAPDEVPVVAYTSRVNPGVPIPADATRIHGITDADVASAPAWAEVAEDVGRACAGRVVVAFNSPFDWSIVRDEQALIGRDPLGAFTDWLDLHILARFVDKFAHSLGQVTSAAGIALDAHGATGDAVSTALIAPELLRAWVRSQRALREGQRAFEFGDDDQYDDDYDEQDHRPVGGASPLVELHIDTLGELLEWQQGAALAQEAEFVSYLRRKGARGRRPDSPWHVLLGCEEPYWPPPPAPTFKVEKDGRVVPVEVAP